jgi:flagellin
MSLNSVNTNIAAQVALQSLNATNSALEQTQKRISTGYRVSDATDDGAAFAVAQKVRSDVGALTTVNQQLGSAKGLVGTAVTSLTNISDSVTQAKSLLVDIGNQSISDDQRNQYITSFKNLVTQVANSVDGSSYNGQTLLGQTGVTGSAKSQNVINSNSGTSSTLNAEDSSTLANALASLIGLTFTRGATGDSFGSVASSAAQTAAAAALTSTATTGFTALQSGVLTQLNQAGADSNLLDATISFNSTKIDSLNAGLGALIDADLSKESANLQSLQIRQQLGTQSLSLANQAPQALLSLFK